MSFLSQFSSLTISDITRASILLKNGRLVIAPQTKRFCIVSPVSSSRNEKNNSGEKYLYAQLLISSSPSWVHSIVAYKASLPFLNNFLIHQTAL